MMASTLTARLGAAHSRRRVFFGAASDAQPSAARALFAGRHRRSGGWIRRFGHRAHRGHQRAVFRRARGLPPRSAGLALPEARRRAHPISAPLGEVALGGTASSVLIVRAVFRRPLIVMLGATGETAEIAVGFLSIMVPSLPVMMISMCAGATVRAHGDGKRAMWGTLADAPQNQTHMSTLNGFGKGTPGYLDPLISQGMQPQGREPGWARRPRAARCRAHPGCGRGARHAGPSLRGGRHYDGAFGRPARADLLRLHQ